MFQNTGQECMKALAERFILICVSRTIPQIYNISTEVGRMTGSGN